MSEFPSRRFHKLHERILLSFWFSLLLGGLFSVALPLSLYWGTLHVPTTTQGQRTAIMVVSAAFLVSHITVRRLRKTYPGVKSGFFIAPQVFAVYILFALGALLLRLEISRLILVGSGIAAIFWFHLEYVATFRYRRLKLAVVGQSAADQLLSLPDIDTRVIHDFDLGSTRYDAVVTDFSQLDHATERFLTKCALSRIAVYDAKAIFESFTGRVQINRMSENNIGSLLPSPTYEMLKRLADLAILVCSLPIVLPICIITAICIKLESPGPVIYAQMRVGQGNKRFVMYKFRSMYVDNKERVAKFASEEDPRVTRVGRIIRQLRIDELPQLINVLNAEMSLIGPRPEQPAFVQRFDEIIPFYCYRHVVKPGITGWAQVRHGYAASTDETQVKIEHDFYYIKNCSLYLDLLIVFLTVKTMLTGFGAR
jgi:exopolysaccharide biosynthesis polyprenyl glycosylphosphotransferase